jgi:hypothetical protein
MKKMISSSLLGVLLFTTTITPVSAATNNGLVRKATVETAFTDFKKSVFINGKDMQVATEALVGKLIDSKVTSGDLQLYVAKNSSQEAYNSFNEMLDTTLEDVGSLSNLGKDEMAFVLQNAFEQTHTTGSNFMSCAAGKSVGMPLLAVGIVLGIISLVNASASKEVVTQEFIDNKRRKTNSYLNTIADLELEITTYESDIIYYQDEVAELQRRIDSGNYSSEQVEQYYLQIRDQEFFISDAHALIGEVNVDLAYFENEFATDIASLELEEVSELNRVEERKASASKTGIAAGIVGGIGAIFTVAGLADCN